MTTWLAWGSAALALALLALGVLFLALNGTATPQGALWLLGLLAFALIGGLIARHHPTNPIGWLFCAGALLSLLAGVASEYARYTLLTRPGTLPGGIWMAWLGAWIGDPGWGLLALFPFLLFPTGHLPSPRWRVVAWLASALIVEAILIHPFAPGLLDTIPPVSNPVGIPALGVIMRAERRLPYFVVLVGTFLAGLLAVVVRFRQARSEERQQLKWVAYVAAVLALLGGGDVLAFGVLGNGLVQGLADTLISLVFPVFPLVVGSAILRYRLYDIDVLINRTLVYGSLTFALGLVYVGGVVLLQPLLHPLVGQDNPRSHRHLDARDRGALPAAAATDPSRDRPAFLPTQVRRGPDAAGLQCDTTRRGRSQPADGRTTHRRRGDDAADARLGLATERAGHRGGRGASGLPNGAGCTTEGLTS